MGMKYLVTLVRKEHSLAELKRTEQKQRTPNWHGTNQIEVKHTSMSSRMGSGGTSGVQFCPVMSSSFDPNRKKNYPQCLKNPVLHD